MRVTTRGALKLARTVHIYISLLGFLMFLFFAVTGVMLNHDSFGWDVSRSNEFTVWLPHDVARNGDERAVVQALRAATGISLGLSQYSAQAGDIEATFAGPGKRTQAVIEKRSGVARVTVEDRGATAMLGDLHKGAASGAVWKAILDAASVLLGISSLTGLVMILGLPKRRRLGILAAVAGTAACVAGWLIWVPR